MQRLNVLNGTTSMPKSVLLCKLDKESNFFSGILCVLDNFQDLPNKSHQMSKTIVVFVVVRMNRCCDVINV